MDRWSRILVGWVVGCVVVGAGMVVLNAPIGSEQWTDERLFLVRLGWVVVALGIAGLVAEVMLVIASLRRTTSSVPSVTAPSAQPDPAQESDEVRQMREQLGELQRKETREQRIGTASALEEMAREAEGMRSDLNAGRNVAAGWGFADSWNTKVHRVLARDTAYDPTLLEAFDAEVPALAQGEGDARANLEHYVVIKGQRLFDIATRIRNEAYSTN